MNNILLVRDFRLFRGDNNSETTRSTPPQQIAVTLPKRSLGRVGGRQPRRGGEDVVSSNRFYTGKYFMRPNLALPEKLALRLGFRPSQLRCEGYSDGDH